ncbi:MAG: hypothetical protein COB53_09935 [Elusimicrobia bacterium]|nr:MAG: hypothetical protein COB53_09935 [Elusimicrobiota bacterium]
MDSKRVTAYALRGGVFVSGALVAFGLVTDTQSIIRVGIMVLIATPLVRVAILGAGFALEGRWRWTATSIFVLAAVGFSALLGIHH